jgi:hypothetical protein
MVHLVLPDTALPAWGRRSSRHASKVLAEESPRRGKDPAGDGTHKLSIGFE